MESLLRAGLIWLAIAAIAVLNGGFREILLRKWLEEKYVHLASTFILSIVIFLLTFGTLPWIGIKDLSSAWTLGVSWLLATLCFEFLAGHYLFGNSWDKIFADYNPMNGRVWLLIPFSILFAPLLAIVGIESKLQVPFLVTNVFGACVLTLSIWRPSAAKWVNALVFASAGAFNLFTSMTNPTAYQDFARHALIPLLRDIIEGPPNTLLIVGTIAVGQILSGVFLILGERTKFLGAVYVTLFLLGIAPLGVGSAFPLSVLLSLAVWSSIGGNQETQK